MNARLPPGTAFEWIVPRDGDYRLYVSAELATHAWFRSPLGVAGFHELEADRFIARLPPPGSRADLDWWIDRQPATLSAVVHLRQGQRLAVGSRAAVPLAVILLSSGDRVLFRQPPPGATLEAESTRVTHFPRFGRIEP